MKRIAVLGAGLAGVSAALALADHGCDVDLLDRCSQPLSRASYGSEGKIHLGFVYAMDRRLDTARTMILGAAAFRPLLERWTGTDLFAGQSLAPFLYAVPQDSMMSSAEIRTHFAAVSKLIAAASSLFHGPAPQDWSELDEAAFRSLFDPSLVATAFQTQETAVDPLFLCHALRQALDHSPRITQLMSSEVTSVQQDDGGYRVAALRPEGQFTETYTTVVNALWEQRLWIDAGLGIRSPRPAIHRYKVGLRRRDSHVSAGLPCVTFLVGPYGDTVAFADAAYVSWYPVGLLSQEVGLRPERFDIPVTEGQRDEIVISSLRNLRRLMPGAESSLDETRPGWTVVGGYISAWGETGIEDRDSELHLRHAVGVHTHENYHSIDTGKLTLAPLFAAEACKRITGR